MVNQCKEVNTPQIDAQDPDIVGAVEVEDITDVGTNGHQEILKALKRKVTMKMTMINLRLMKNQEDHTDVEEDVGAEVTEDVVDTEDAREVKDPVMKTLHKMRDDKVTVKVNRKDDVKMVVIDDDPDVTDDDQEDHLHRALAMKGTVIVIEVNKKSVVNEVNVAVVGVVTGAEDVLEETTVHVNLEAKEKRQKGAVLLKRKINHQMKHHQRKFKLNLYSVIIQFIALYFIASLKVIFRVISN